MLSELVGEGWVMVEPPLPRDGQSVVCRHDSEKIKAGFKTETIEDSSEKLHIKYRTGQYDLELKIDFVIGRGQMRLEEAEGYDKQEVAAD